MISYMFGIITGVVSCIWFFISGGKVIGKDNLPNEPFILVSNHVSYADWLILHNYFRFFYRKKICFVAKKRLFEQFWWRLLMEYSGAVYVDQESPKKTTLNNIKKAFHKKHIVGVFPEGKRSKTGKLLKAKNGVIKISLMSKKKLVPIGLKDFHNIWPVDKKFPRLIKSCSINIGKPIDISGAKKNEDNLNELTRNLMKEIAILSDQEYVY